MFSQHVRARDHERKPPGPKRTREIAKTPAVLDASKFHAAFAASVREALRP